MRGAGEYNVQYNKQKLQHSIKKWFKIKPEKSDQMSDPGDEEGIQRHLGSFNFLRDCILSIYCR